MTKIAAQPRILVITGMHRSGTSMIAHWLQICGLYLGKDLLPGVPSNPKGHFEDIDFVRLHMDILKSNRLGHSVHGRRVILVGGEFLERTRKLIAERERIPQWGWKDPRTSLFLDFWHTLLPEAKYLFVFRPYAQVVDSLKRREGGMRKTPPVSFWKDFLYTRVFKRYNDDILAFAGKHRNRSLCMSVDDVIARSEQLITFFNSVWRFNFSLKPISAVFEHRYMKNKSKRLQTMLCHLMCPSVRETWRRLEAIGKEDLARIQL